MLEAFGLVGAAERLPGGQGGTWRLGEVVLKPSPGQDFLRWVSDVLSRLDGRRDFRVSPPLRARDGSWSVAGWTAWRYRPGMHQPGRWLDIVRVADIFHKSIQQATRPAFLAGRTDRWAVADRLAWDELPLPAAIGQNSLIQETVAAQRAIPARSQLVHGDLAGNVLFHPELPPLIIDVSPYWRPARFGTAVVVADALVREGASDQLTESLGWDADDAQSSCGRCSSARSPICSTSPTRSRAASPAATSQRWSLCSASQRHDITPPRPARGPRPTDSLNRRRHPVRLRILH